MSYTNHNSGFGDTNPAYNYIPSAASIPITAEPKYIYNQAPTEPQYAYIQPEKEYTYPRSGSQYTYSQSQFNIPMTESVYFKPVYNQPEQVQSIPVKTPQTFQPIQPVPQVKYITPVFIINLYIV